MTGGGGGGGNGNDATYEYNIRRDEENQRQNRIREGTNRVNTSFDSMFTPDFYSGREKAVLDYYTPQIDDQFADAQKKLTFNLADRGLLDSSVRNEKTAELQKLYDTGKRQINDSALNASNKAKTDVATARAGLIEDVRNGNPADDNSVASSIGMLTAPETYSPLADMFGGFTSALSQQAALERASALSGGAIKPAFNTGLFAPSSSVVNQR